MLGWATASTVGESEIALRLWSVVPFILGVALVTIWLDRELGHLTGIVFLFLATLSPLLLDISRQARGYGLAFLAMAVLVIAGIEATRRSELWPGIAACVAGFVGTATLPVFGVAFFAISVVLLANPKARRTLAFGLPATVIAIAAWYAPHVDDLLHSSRQAYGVPIEPWWLVTAPVDQILLPALIWIDGVVLFPGLVWIPTVAIAVILMSTSPLLRGRMPASILIIGPVATIAALFVTDTRAVPRFLSFLLVPLFMLIASGTAAIFERLPTRPTVFRSLVAAVLLAVLAGSFVARWLDVVRLPREAHKDAVSAIRARGWSTAPVFAYVVHPLDLAFYLGRAPAAGRRPEFARVACSRHERIVIVVQQWAIPNATFPCITHTTPEIEVRQYTRGRRIRAWLVPPSPQSS